MAISDFDSEKRATLPHNRPRFGVFAGFLLRQTGLLQIGLDIAF
jgi:hypothetical protein